MSTYLDSIEAQRRHDRDVHERTVRLPAPWARRMQQLGTL